MRCVVVRCVVWCVVLFTSLLAAVAQERPGIPQQALDALQFFVGSWESEDSENGQALGKGSDVREWASGKCCVTMSGEGSEAGRTIEYAGISGWDPKGEQLVEHWHATDGLYVTIRYPLSEMKAQLWSGTLTVILGDGTQSDGTCTLEKTKDGFVFTARTTQEGKETVRKSIARRIERESVKKK